MNTRRTNNRISKIDLMLRDGSYVKYLFSDVFLVSWSCINLESENVSFKHTGIELRARKDI